MQSFLTLPTEAVSELYLTGVGNRSYFDARAIYFLSLSGNQSQVPVVAPVIDYSNVINHSVLGGEFSYKTNFTSLTRETAVFDPITAAALANGLTPTNSADPARNIVPANCLLRGMPGTYTRFDGRSGLAPVVHRFGGRNLDAVCKRPRRRDRCRYLEPAGCCELLPVGDTQALRVMPTVGLEYRYPFINVQPWGTTTIEPIAQVITRPNEPYAGKLPNEDAQSMVFDTSNLFSVDKFSGYDRVEGGGRANVGVQATTQFDRGGSVTAVFGQSYQLFGLNSFAVARHDQYRCSIPVWTTPNRTTSPASPIRPTGPTPSARARDLTRRPGACSASRLKAAPTSIAGRSACCTVTMPLSPDMGYLTRREGILGQHSVKLAQTGC